MRVLPLVRLLGTARTRLLRTGGPPPTPGGGCALVALAGIGLVVILL